jgi:hypothetical protein
VEHKYLTSTQRYAHVYDEALYSQFRTAMSQLEAIAVEDWPGIKRGQPALVETWTEGVTPQPAAVALEQ